MTLHPRLPPSAVELVKRFEGLRRRAVRTPEGGWTVGYGHTASAREGVEVSEKDAEALLLYDLSRVALAVEAAVMSPLNENQFGAVVAFAFNVGPQRFARSEVLKRLNEGAYLRAAAALELWRRSDFEGESIVVDALVRRRAAEKLLFLTPPDGFRPAPTPLVPPQHDPEPLGLVEDLDVPLEGEGDAVRLHRAESPEALEETAPVVAARSVIERLNAILQDEPIVPPIAEEPAQAPARPAWTPSVVSEPEPPPFPQAEPSHPVVRLRAAFRALEEEPHPVWAARAERNDGPSPKVIVQPEPHPEPIGRPEWSRPAPAPRVSLAVLALGVFGFALFAAAMATIVFGRATWTNLALGLIGVVAMLPAAARLIGGRDRID